MPVSINKAVRYPFVPDHTLYPFQAPISHQNPLQHSVMIQQPLAGVCEDPSLLKQNYSITFKKFNNQGQAHEQSSQISGNYQQVLRIPNQFIQLNKSISETHV